MRSLLWKECHATLKWAAVPSLLILVPMALLGGPGTPPAGTELFGVHILAAVFGAVLGFLQVFFEARGDQRALLLHRPLSPSQIFLGKALAGVGVYLLGMGLPLAALAVWCATPGHLSAPFSWRALLPWLADLLTGVVYFFAGMLTAQREGRWYGSRGLGVAAAFLATVLVWALPEFWQALLALGVLGTLLGVAAWGSFLGGGAYAPQPWVAKAALAVTFLTGLLMLSATVKITLEGYLDSGVTYSYYLDRQGRVLLVPWKTGQGPFGQVTDLDGHVPPEYQAKRLDRNTLDEIEAPSAGLSPWRHVSYRNIGRLFVEYENETLVGGERWFYDPEQGRLVGYDRKQRVLIGSYGPDGFVPAGEQPRGRFQGELLHMTRLWDAITPDYLIFSGGVYDVDFSRHTLRTLFTPAEGETVLWAREWRDPQQKAELIFVCTDSTDRPVHVLTEEGAPVVSLPRAYDRGTYGLTAGRLDDPRRYFCWYRPLLCLQPEESLTLPSHLVEYDAAGHEIGRRTVPHHPSTEPSYAAALLGLATPPAEAAAVVGATRSLRSGARLTGDQGRWVLYDLLEEWTAPYFIPGSGREIVSPPGVVPGFVALMLLSAAACAVACFLLGRRATFSRARLAGWSLCGLVFGPVGLLLLLALQMLPARIRCPACGRPRVVDRDRCEHCGAAHARPAPDGTEIFETVPAADAALAGN
jgi:hypothetical protein